MTKPSRPAAPRQDTRDPAQFRQEVRRNTGGRRVNPAPEEPQPEKEPKADE